MKFINERQCHIIFWTFYSVLINAFFFFISIKAVFVLASNHFQKCFSVNAGVWLRMENKFSRKYFQLTVCFSWFDPEMVWSENFHFKPFPDSCAERERESLVLRPSSSPTTTAAHAPDRALVRRPQTEPIALRQSSKDRIAPIAAPSRLQHRVDRSITPRTAPIAAPCTSLFLLLSIWPDLMNFFF